MTAELRIYESNDLKPANTRARATVIFSGGLLDGITVSDIRICDPASQGESLQVRSASLVGLQEHTPLGQLILSSYREGYMARGIHFSGGDQFFSDSITMVER